MRNDSGFTLARSLVIKAAIMCLMLVQPAMAEDEGQACDPNGQQIAYGDVLAGCNIEIVTDLDTFTFMGTAGEHVTIIATRTGGGFQCVVIRDPDGGQVVLPCGNIRHDFQLPRSGQYRIFVTEQFNDSAVTFNLSLERLFPLRGPTAVGPGQIIAGREIMPAADIDTFQFNGIAGDEFLVIITRTGGGFPCGEIRSPDDTILVPLACAGTLNLNSGPLPVSGVYQVVITEQFNDANVSFNLSLNCLTGACPNPPPTCIVDPSFVGTTLLLDFTIGTPESSRWSTAILAFATSYPLFARNLGTIDPPISGPIAIPNFPSVGRIGVLSTLTTAAGLTCSSLATVDTGLPTSDVDPATLERSLRGR